MKITIFSEELRKCLDAAGLSDCGENDEWNYWYQRVLKAHNDVVERQIATEQSENAKLRELVQDYDRALASTNVLCDRDFAPFNDSVLLVLRSRMYELGIEADDE